MAKEVLNSQIMLLSGGIEFHRMENCIASPLCTSLEQEEKNECQLKEWSFMIHDAVPP
jgi:hypothetical protein